MMIVVTVMALMAACHPDEKNGKNTGTGTVSGEPDNSVFLALNVALPPAGPSAKADGVGSETGTKEESEVSTMLVVLADKDNNNYITHGTLVHPTLSTNNNVTGVASMDRNGLSNYYASNEDPDVAGKLQNGKENINVFVFCNYTQELLEAVRQSSQAALAEEGRSSSQWIHAAGSVTKTADEGIWANGYFLMSNQFIAMRTIPASLKDWNKYGEESNAFNLCGQNSAGGSGIDNSAAAGKGPITVQRVMARIDLKDGSLGNWTYQISTTGSGSSPLHVKIERVALVNQSKEFFYLKHVAKPGTEGAANIADLANSDICGSEIGDGLSFSYVVDADAAADYKQKSGTDQEIDAGATAAHYMYPLFNANGNINDDVRKNWKATGTEDFGKDKYTPWVYTTENTTPHNANRAGITTGIVFKGRLTPNENVNQTLRNAANGNYKIPEGHTEEEYYLTKVDNGSRVYPLLYAFGETNRKLYVGWNDQVKTAVDDMMKIFPSIADLPEGTIAYAYYTPCYTPEGENEKVSPKDMFDRLLAVQKNNAGDNQAIVTAREAFKAAAVEAGFTVYQAGLAIDDFEGDQVGQDADDAGYFCYYFYWIRHNLAESEGDIYPMEYGVVRNNVYKLSVQSIRRFGHPRLSAHDTDPMKVNTPCEKSEIYLTVEVQVAPWVTRESSIIL